MSDAPESLYGPDDQNAAPPEPKGPTLMDQLVGVFTAPGELFDRLRKTPAWVSPYLLLGTLTSVFLIT